MTENADLHRNLMSVPARVHWRDRSECDGVETWHESFASFPSLRIALEEIEREEDAIVVDAILLETAGSEIRLEGDDIALLLRAPEDML